MKHDTHMMKDYVDDIDTLLVFVSWGLGVCRADVCGGWWVDEEEVVIVIVL